MRSLTIFKTSGLLLLLFVCTGAATYAQILNDSAKELYGYSTVRYGTEEDLFQNAGKNKSLDSTLLYLQRYGYLYRNNQLFQDQGNWGTPLKAVTNPLPLQIGRQTGFDSYTPYAYDPDQIRYFDTRSPFTEIQYYQGSRGQQRIEASFNRNINPQWNIGFDFRRIASKQIIGRVAKTDRQAENYAFDFFISNQSKNKRYTLLASFSHLYQINFETGGIKPNVGDTKENLFDYDLERVWLDNTRSLDKRYNYRVYQHYSLIRENALQVFYRFDYSRRTNRYDDNLFATNKIYYDTAYGYKPQYDNGSIRDRADFDLLDNRAGFKGTLGSLFYAAYAKSRYVRMIQNTYSDSASINTDYTEWYAGGQLKKTLDGSGAFLDVKGEWGMQGDYLGLVSFYKNRFTVKASAWAVSPALMQQQYISNMTSWQNDFDQQKISNVFAQYEYKSRVIDVTPALSVSSFTDYIYFTALGKPEQYKESIQHIQPSVGLRFNVWKVHIYNMFQYNYLSKDTAALRMPSVVNVTQIFWESWLFKKATKIQAGFDFQFRNSYYGYAYNPVLQQYNVSNTGGSSASFNYINGYMLVDFFVNMQVRKARLFLKMSNLTQGIVADGYFSSPFYTGLPRTLDFGISWRFFD